MPKICGLIVKLPRERNICRFSTVSSRVLTRGQAPPPAVGPAPAVPADAARAQAPGCIVKSRLLIAVIHTNRQRHPTFRGRPIRDDPLRYVELQFETQEAANAAEEQLKGLLKYATEIEFREVGPAVGLEMKKAEVAKRLARYEILQAHKGAAAN